MIFNIAKLISLSFVVILITSCSTKISDYEQSTPKFDIKRYFTGELIAWGMVQDYTNQVTRRFCVELTGTWNGNQGELDEVFYFKDGEVSYRTWQLTKLENDEYTGTAADVVGIANGKQSGFAFQWQYQLLVPIDENTYQFTMDDWMYQLDEHRVFNKTTMNKFGVKAAEITLFFDKAHPSKTCDLKEVL
tara:strand:+ start:2971 stop:3540 length:570 start_codon:yes stop_codon:yes gene_type:complete